MVVSAAQLRRNTKNPAHAVGYFARDKRNRNNPAKKNRNPRVRTHYSCHIGAFITEAVTFIHEGLVLGRLWARQTYRAVRVMALVENQTVSVHSLQEAVIDVYTRERYGLVRAYVCVCRG